MPGFECLNCHFRNDLNVPIQLHIGPQPAIGVAAGATTPVGGFTGTIVGVTFNDPNHPGVVKNVDFQHVDSETAVQTEVRFCNYNALTNFPGATIFIGPAIHVIYENRDLTLHAASV